MRLRFAVFFVATVSASAALAQDQAPPNPLTPVSNVLQALSHNPDGWTRNMDGSYRHAESGVLCPVRFKAFDLGDVTGPSADAPNIIGTCRYNDGAGRTGSIRIRKFVEGWGSDLSIASNDKSLMATDGSAPAMLMRASTDRKTGASRLTVTTDRRNYLIDCSVAQIEHSTPKGDFPLYCTTIP